MDSHYAYRDGNGQPTDEPSLRMAHAEENGLIQAPVANGSAILEVQDRLLAENLALKVQNLSLQKAEFVRQANAQVAEFNERIGLVHKEINALQSTLSQKYGIDFSTHQIEPGTGRVTPVS
jgi:hypothetical protein